MAFIGNTPTTQAFTPAVDYFSGNASTTAFTLSRPVASVAQVQVVIDNVAQNPSSAYTISGSTITFTSAPLSGTNNIYVYYTSPITQVIAPGQGTAGTTALDVYGGAGTSAMNLPSGTTAQRPGSPVAGATRFNSTLGFAEYWTGSQWATYGNISASSVSYLIVAGGGGTPGSDNSPSGGGGAGGLLTGTVGVTAGTSYTVTVGAGGSGSGAGVNAATSGSNSLFSAYGTTAIGGGKGAWDNTSGTAGGSGGGGSLGGSGGAGTSGQGNSGGSAVFSGSVQCGGGGGGAGAVGSNGTSTGNGTGGAGGVGVSSSISGSSVYYAGGGGGGGWTAGGAGGNGGGGSGNGGGSGGANGTANTGGGGGASGANGTGGSNTTGFNGGSGVVIISYPSSYKDATATGTYTKTFSGGNTIYTFTQSGTITF